MQSYIFGGNTGMTYEQIQRQREIANELLKSSMARPRTVGEGLSAIGDALLAKKIDKRTSKADEANRAAYESRKGEVFGMLGGFGPGGANAPYGGPVKPAAPATPAQAVADDAMNALGKTPMRPFRDAIASIESAGSGDYSAVGPTHPKLGRALGRYQIMEANIGPWSREVLGREVTPEEFIANPQLQDAIFDGKFGGYVQQFGPEGAAQAWFAGPGGVGKMDRQDSLGTSVAEYTQKFSSALGGTPSAQPTGGMANPAVLMALADVQGNPYASESDKAIAKLLMDQTVQSMDPMRALEMERAQLELEALRNPPEPELPADVLELQWRAENAGLVPGTPEYQDFIRTGGSGPLVDFSGANIGGEGQGVPQPQLGTIPQGFSAIPDPASPAGYRMVAIPGGPEDNSAKTEAAADAALTASDVVTTAANRALEAAGNRALGGFGQGAVSMLPWTDSAEVARNVGVLGSQATIETLTAMREASPTGGALGSVTEGELQILKQKSGALDPSSPTFERDLADYTLTLLETIHGVDTGREVFRQTWQGEIPERLSRQQSAPEPQQSEDVPQGIDPEDWKYMTPEERALFE